MKRIMLILPFVLFTACSAPNPVPSESDLVVEGWICAGESPVVKVTTGVVPSSEFASTDELQNHVVKWAKVTVSDGETSAVLFGKPDEKYFPPYIYTTGWISGVPGKTYSITVEYEDKTATATTTVPEPEPLLRLDSVLEDNGQYSLVATLGNKAGERKFYRFLTMVEGVDTEFQPAFPGSLASEDLRENAEIIIYRNRTLSNRTLSGRFEEGDVVHVRLCTMDRESWAFWNGIDNLSMMNLPVFTSFKNPESNISGGLGIWSGYGISDYTVTIGL